MASVSSTGLGSGIDINNLVSSLVEAERAPTVSRLDSKEAALQSELSAVGLLKGALSTFQSSLSGLKDSEALSARTASITDTSIANLSVTNEAAAGSYSLEVTSLASAQKLVTQQDYVVSEGTLEFANASGSFTVTLSSNNNATIQDVRDAINNASDNIGVTATIINVNGNERLVFNTDDTGADSGLTITGTSTSGDLDIYDYNSGTATPDVNGDVAGFYDQVTAAADAVFAIDGQSMTSATNTLEDIIPGSTITLKDTNAGDPVTMTVSVSNNQLKTQINKLVDGYNELISTINDLTAYDSATQRSGALFGDSLANGLERQLRNMLTSAVENSGSSYTSLASLGITTQSDGSLKVDSTKLTNALANDYQGVQSMFTATDTGLAPKIDALVNTYLAYNGSFSGRTDSINARLDSITEQRDNLDLRMTQLEARLYSQYNAMDALVYSLNQTGSWLESTLATLPGVVSTSKK